jgi:large subunit ribosomal protein L33
MKKTKKKQARISIILECIECIKNLKKRSFGISRYISSKNRINTPNKIELLKHCKYCNVHTIHKEIK